MQTTRDFTISVYIVHKKSVLLHMHKQLNVWLPVGGHIDPNELPETAAHRESKEESGLDIKLYNPDQKLEMKDVGQLIRPMYLLLEDIEPFHQHIDLVYFATSNSHLLTPQHGETKQIKWFTINEVKTLTLSPGNVTAMAIQALNLLGR